jgi:hypothetical protein
MQLRKPSERELDVVRWVVAAALAVTYIFTGYEPVFYLGIAVLLVPLLLKMNNSRQGPKDPH